MWLPPADTPFRFYTGTRLSHLPSQAKSLVLHGIMNDMLIMIAKLKLHVFNLLSSLASLNR